MKKRIIIGQYRLCDFLTMTGTLSAFIGMVLAINGYTTIPFILLLVCCLTDSFDGFVARLRKNTEFETSYGIELDSLNDVIAFGAFPVVLALCTVNLEIIKYIVPFYGLCGVIRLTYFNALHINKMEEKGYFRGVPITCISFIYPPVCLLHLINYNVYEWTTVVLFILMGILFVLNIRVKKPSIDKLIKKSNKK